MRVLHIIDQIGAGGPARSLLGLVKHGRTSHPQARHNVVSLADDAYPPLVFAARKLGCQVLRVPSQSDLLKEIEASEVVLLHLWNTPRMWRFLAQAPKARYVIWSKILGASHPQILASDCISNAAHLILTAPCPGDQLAEIDPDRVSVIPGIADFDRLHSARPVRHDGFNVDFVGTVNAGKIHPQFAAMMSDIEIPGVAIRLFGGQPDDGLMSSISNSKDPSRFHIGGFVEDIASVLSTSDVFGYPLSPHTYATSDKSLQEAMYAGVPPVVLAHAGPARFVTHGQTGLVVETVEEFPRAVEWLYNNPHDRKCLALGAQQYAQSQFRPEIQSKQILDVLETASLNETAAGFGIRSDLDPGVLFLLSQGCKPDLAERQMLNWLQGDCQALDRWMEGLPEEVFQVEGGIFHWRGHNPDHPFFGWWSARRLLQQGRTGEAGREVSGAVLAQLPPGKPQEFQRLLQSCRPPATQGTMA